MTPCSATRQDGTPCRAPAQPESTFCWGHRPDLAERRRDARAKGGLNKSTSKRLERKMPVGLRPVLDKLYAALEGVEDGTIEPRQGTAMATIATAITRIYEMTELELRLQLLERDREQRSS